MEDNKKTSEEIAKEVFFGLLDALADRVNKGERPRFEDTPMTEVGKVGVNYVRKPRLCYMAFIRKFQHRSLFESYALTEVKGKGDIFIPNTQLVVFELTKQRYIEELNKLFADISLHGNENGSFIYYYAPILGYPIEGFSPYDKSKEPVLSMVTSILSGPMEEAYSRPTLEMIENFF
jgi:hypothetical protein